MLLFLFVVHRYSTDADLIQLCGRLAVFMLFRGEFWSVKFIETRVLINKERGPKRDIRNKKSKQNIEKEVGYWTVYNSFKWSFVCFYKRTTLLGAKPKPHLNFAL